MWRIYHYSGRTCVVAESDVIARSGHTQAQLNQKNDVQLSGGWYAERIQGGKS